MKWEEIELFVNAMIDLKGKRVRVKSSLYNSPHSRHPLTSSNYTVEVTYTGLGMSGGQLMLFGDQAGFVISVDWITSFSIGEDGKIELVANLEKEMEFSATLQIV